MNRYPSQARNPQFRMGLLVLLAIMGCGENKNEGAVSGTVTYQGNPLPQGTVTFLDSSNTFLASSAISDGKYVIRDKMPVGLVKITVTTLGNNPRSRNPNFGAKAKRGEPIRAIPIPAKYGSAEQSGLTYTLKSGANTYNIELE